MAYLFGSYKNSNNGEIKLRAPEHVGKTIVDTEDPGLHGDGYYLFETLTPVLDGTTVRCKPLIKLANGKDLTVAIAEEVNNGLAQGTRYSRDFVSFNQYLYEDEALWLCYNLASALIYRAKNEDELTIWRICRHAGMEYENISVSAEVLLQRLADRSMSFFDMLVYANTIVESKPETAKLFPATHFFDDGHCCDSLVFVDLENMEPCNFVSVNDDVALFRWKKAIPPQMHISEKNNFGFRVSFDFDESMIVHRNQTLIGGGLVCAISLYDARHSVNVRYFSKEKLAPYYQAHGLTEYEGWLVPAGLPDWKIENLENGVDEPIDWAGVTFTNGAVGAYTLKYLAEQYPGKCLNADLEKTIDERGKPHIQVHYHA